MRQKLREYELFTKLLIIIFIALCAQAIIISWFIYHRSKDVYIELFDKSNAVVLKKIQSDFETLNDNVENTLTAVQSNPAVGDYFSTTAEHSSITLINQLNSIQKMNNSFGEIYPNIDYDLLIFGENGRTFIGNDMLTVMDSTDFYRSELIEAVNANPADTQMLYAEHGLTKRDQDSPSVLFIKKLKNSFNKIYGYGVISISSQQFANLFDTMVNSNVSEIYFINDDQTIITANIPNKIGKQSDYLEHLDINETRTLPKKQVTRLPLYRQNLSLVSAVNVHLLTNQMGVILPIILYNILTILFVGMLVFMYLNRNTKSIYTLIHSLKKIKEDPLKTKVPVQGTYEIQVLGDTINQLLGDLNAYYDSSIQNEKKKRFLEIQAMQAQIQPHFIYNTLTSLKFLIWQQENGKAVKGIDSFIDLLRSTIGKKEEIIPVKEELKSVQSYIDILTLRYGENISAKIMIPDELLSLMIPNMIIQPIIENAYLHAFTSKKNGFITIYGKTKQESLIFEIIDSGDGFDVKKIKKEKSNYFSGIGMNNVDERVRLLYGSNYGITVASVIGIGTTVKIRLPIIKSQN